jgi:hypothetical protein
MIEDCSCPSVLDLQAAREILAEVFAIRISEVDRDAQGFRGEDQESLISRIWTTI